MSTSIEAFSALAAGVPHFSCSGTSPSDELTDSGGLKRPCSSNKRQKFRLLDSTLLPPVSKSCNLAFASTCFKSARSASGHDSVDSAPRHELRAANALPERRQLPVGPFHLLGHQVLRAGGVHHLQHRGDVVRLVLVKASQASPSLPMAGGLETLDTMANLIETH